MNKEELKFLVSQNESYNLEFKESFSGSLGRDICAFANANGGKVLLGVSDDGKIKERLVEGLVEGLVESQRKILKIVKKKPHISKKEMSEIIGISTTSIDKNIFSLKKKGILKRVEPAKGGYWKVVEKTKEVPKLPKEKR